MRVTMAHAEREKQYTVHRSRELERFAVQWMQLDPFRPLRSRAPATYDHCPLSLSLHPSANHASLLHRLRLSLSLLHPLLIMGSGCVAGRAATAPPNNPLHLLIHLEHEQRGK